MEATRNPSAPAQSIVIQVLDAVAAYVDIDPLELPSLYEAIDPEALDSLITSMPEGSVAFSYAGYTVSVDASGSIEISDSLPDW